MEHIYAGMASSKSRKDEMFKIVNKRSILPGFLGILRGYTWDSLLPLMQQWEAQQAALYPEYYDHITLLCVADPKYSSKDDLKEYREYRAKARKAGVPDHYFNEYLMQVLVAQRQSAIASQSPTETEDYGD